MANFNCPVEKARLTSAFGYRNIGRGRERHQGVDLASPVAGKKVPVYASSAGKVVYAKALSTYGNSVRIVHTIGGITYETNYAHLDSITVKVDQTVKQGQQIGVMGNTGGSFGVHLHFEIHKGRYAPGQPNAVDPMKYITLNTCKPYAPIEENIVKGATAFRLQTAPYRDKAKAQLDANRLVEDKYFGYAEVLGDGKGNYRIRSGKYSSRDAAHTAGMKMINNGQVKFLSLLGALS